MWYGEYNHTLDEKDRFILPSKFREKVKVLKQKRFYITRGLDGCLFFYDHATWETIEDKFKDLPFTKKETRFFNRMFFSGAHEIVMDVQGRISLPAHLKEFAKITRDIVIIGVTDRIEVWAKESWEKFYGDNRERFEEVAENLFE